MAALLIVAERVGKAIRNPPRNVMLSHAGSVIGHGWVFGLHEALDKFGAFVGPLAVSVVLARQGQYQTAFALLLIPALTTIALVLIARKVYPRPEEMEQGGQVAEAQGTLPRRFWIYFAGAGLVAAGFPDFSLMSFHLSKTEAVPTYWIPIFYSFALGISGISSLLFGRLFDRHGIRLLIPVTVATVAFVPMVFMGGFATAFAGVILWGISMGMHESLIPAAVAGMVAKERRASAYGIFSAGYGISWFIGSAAIGMLYDWSVPAVTVFCIVFQLAALPFFLAAGRK